jgi:hypothetical protein
MVVGRSVTRFTWLEKKHGVQFRKGICFGKTWAQVATLWGKRNLVSSYLENSFQRVAKSYPKVFCFPFWPLANFGCPLAGDGQPDYFTNWGGWETLLVAVYVFWRFLLTWKIRFQPIWRNFHENYVPNSPYFEGN